MQQHDELPMLAGLSGILHWIEEAINIFATPLLMGGLIIALIDLLTDGALTVAIPWIVLAWAISQAVGVEANMTGSVYRVIHAWRKGKWLPAFLYFLLVLALAGVATIAGYAYAFHQSQSVPIPQTLTDLGINAATWTLTRSLLSVILVIVSRMLAYTGEKTTTQDTVQKLRDELELAPLRAQVGAQKLLGARHMIAAAVKGTPAPPSQPITQEYDQPNQTPYGPVAWGGDFRDAIPDSALDHGEPSIHLVKSSATPVRTPRRRTPPRKPRGAASWEVAARQAWVDGHRTVGRLEHAVEGMSHTAAQYWAGVFRGEERGEERGRQEA
jgi:hypothetical protein